MARNPKGALNRVLDVPIIYQDVRDAVCGSQSRCTIANAIRRRWPASSFIRVSDLKITITYAGYVHHYAMTEAGLQVVQGTDTGKLPLTFSDKLVFPMIGIPTMATLDHLTPGRKAQVNAARKARAAAGKKDRTDYPRLNRRLRTAAENDVKNQTLIAAAVKKAKAAWSAA